MKLGLAATAILAAIVCALAGAPRASAQGSDAGQSQLKEISVATNAFSVGEPIPTWVEQVAIPTSGRSDPLVLRLADTQLQLGTTLMVFVRRALVVNDAGSLSDAGHLPIGFVPQYQRLQLHAIRIHRGQEILDRTSSPVRFLQRETGLEGGIYSGQVTASILVSDLRVGDTLEYAYTVHGQNPVFGGKFFQITSWDQPYPVLQRRVSIAHPANRPISWRLLGDGAAKPPVPRESAQAALRKLQFEESDIAAMLPENSIPADYLPFRMLQFSEFASLDEVVAWAGGLFKTEGAPDNELRAVVARISAHPTLEERVAAALEFVQSEIRYFSVSLGESSHRPAPPSVVLKRRYGDCKDKSLLLMTLLKEIGVNSSPVLLSLQQPKGMDRLLPSPQLFDHVIVQVTVDGASYFLDPTRLGQYGRLKRMGQAHEGSQVLVIAPGTRQFVTIASSNRAELIKNELSEVGIVAQFDGDARLRAQDTWVGMMAEYARTLRERVPHEQFVKLMVEDIETRYPGARLAGELDIRDDRVENVFAVTAEYTVPNMVQERDGNRFVRFSAANLKNTFPPMPTLGRKSPLAVPRFPFDGRYSFEMRFPDEVSAMFDPYSESVVNPAFRHRVTSSFRGNVAKTTVDLTTLKDRVEVGEIAKYVDDLRRANNSFRTAIVVRKADIKPSTAAAKKKDFATSLRERLQDRAEKVSQAIKSGKLSGSDLAAAHCNRGTALAELGRSAEAVSDGNEAVKLMPDHTETLVCRGNIYFTVGQIEQSVTDYSKAVILGATDPLSFYRRGISQFYAGRLENAASDLAKASDTANGEAQVYSDLWLSWTQQRLGKPVPEAVMQRAAVRPRGDWPRPALATLTGKLAPEEMLKLIEAKTGDDRQMALAEGYFYLGQHYLTRGDQRRAQEMFERSRQIGVLGYIEHIASEFELRRLSSVLPTAPAPATTPAAVAPATARPVAQPAAAPAAKAAPVFSDAPPSEDLRSAN